MAVTSILDFPEQFVQILFRPKHRVDFAVIQYVVADVDAAVLVERWEPDAVNTQALDVIQLPLNACK